MKTLTRAKKIGGSIMVTIPKEIIREKNIREGELVRIDVEKAKKDYFGIFRGMNQFKKEKFSDFD